VRDMAGELGCIGTKMKYKKYYIYIAVAAAYCICRNEYRERMAGVNRDGG